MYYLITLLTNQNCFVSCFILESILPTFCSWFLLCVLSYKCNMDISLVRIKEVELKKIKSHLPLACEFQFFINSPNYPTCVYTRAHRHRSLLLSFSACTSINCFIKFQILPSLVRFWSQLRSCFVTSSTNMLLYKSDYKNPCTVIL